MAYDGYMDSDVRWQDPKRRIRWEVDCTEEEVDRISLTPIHGNRWMLWLDARGVAFTLFISGQQAQALLRSVEPCMPQPEPRIVYVQAEDRRKTVRGVDSPERVPYPGCNTARKRKARALRPATAAPTSHAAAEAQ